MDDFGMLARDFGFPAHGKSAPMKSGLGSDRDRRSTSAARPSAPIVDDRIFNDVFGGPPKYSTTSNSNRPSSMSEFDYDSIFKGPGNESKSKSTTTSSVPVYDKPVYDDDIFDGLPGLKSKSVSSSARYEDDVFASIASPPKKRSDDHFDDLLGNLGGRREKKVEPTKNRKSSSDDFDDLLPGFGSSGGSNRQNSEPSQPPKATGNPKQTASSVMDDPFVVLEPTLTPAVSSPGPFSDPLEHIGKFSKSSSTKTGVSSVSGDVFDDIDPLNGFGKHVPAFSSEINDKRKDASPSRAGSNWSSPQTANSKESLGKSSFTYSDIYSQKKVPVDDYQESPRIFDLPNIATDSQKSFSQTASPPSYVNATFNGTNSQADISPRSEEHIEQSDDVWVTVSEIPLFTQPTSAPPPSRPPPPIPGHASNFERGPFTRKQVNDFSSSPYSAQYSQNPKPFHHAASQMDDFEDFAMGRARNIVNENADVHLGDEMDANSAAAASAAASAAAASAAAMKDAMDRAEAKFRHAKEVREREYAKASRNKEAVQLEKDEQLMQDSQHGDFEENQERLERERRQKEEEEKERRRLERERAKEIEREKARQAVERATREARERAANEARERAVAEARLKSERAAVQRAQAEARERAAADARGRAERLAAEARERANAEAKEKEMREKAAVARAEAEARRRAERAAVDRVAAEARERAAAEARERAAAASRMNQQKNDNDLESFFGMGSRPNSAPRPRASYSSESVVDPPSRGGPEGARKTSSTGVSSNMRKTSSTTNVVDDLTSIFGGTAASGGFPDVEGETEERRRARWERHQRTQERAEKALAEKNQRDLQTQREQDERHRIAETLDAEIKRWAAGKEGNLRVLLSTMQYVLWPECGWQPVSLTDLITGASVKKVYRKATLCIHPDKVQQKGANLQQKYIAEKVFDLLKEAWNKFNSEELF